MDEEKAPPVMTGQYIVLNGRNTSRFMAAW
jgi:hypothetical protein